MNINRTLAVAFVATIAIAFSDTPASAQSKCDAGKLKQYGKKVFCLAKVDSKAAKRGEAVDAAKEQKCVDKFIEKCAKAEGRGDCTGAVKDCADLMTEADVCRAASIAPSTTTTSTTSTTMPATCPMDDTACVSYRDVLACTNCCDLSGPCASDCGDASDLLTMCLSSSSNEDCRLAVEAAGCASVCCP